MVSSRWVLGSSNGMREFSASRITNQLATTRTSDAPAVNHPADQGASSIGQSESERDSLAITRRPKKSAGSASEAKLTSRAAPIPSKAEPVSRAAEAMKNR